MAWIPTSVGDTGIEPETSSVSRKRASPCANRPAVLPAEHYTGGVRGSAAALAAELPLAT